MSLPPQTVTGKLASMAADTCPEALALPLGEANGAHATLQPITRLLDRAVVGYEVVIPGEEGGEAVPATDDRGAEEATTIELACLRARLDLARRCAPASLFLELTPATLHGSQAARRLAELAADAGVAPQDVVVTLSERSSVTDIARLRRIVGDLRSCGFRIAIRVGGQDTGLLMIAEVRPDLVAIGADVVRGVHRSEAQRALVVAILSFATHLNAPLVAEGIDHEDDLRALVNLGIQFGRGAQVGAEIAPESTPDHGLTQSHPVEAFPFEPISGGRAGQAAPGPRASGRVSLPHALSRAARVLQAEHDPQRILAVIAEQLSMVVPVDDLSIYAADHANHLFVAAFANGHQAAAIMADVFSMSAGLNGWAFALGTPQNIANAGAHPAAVIIPNTPFEHESLLLIPLVAGDHKLGMLNCRRMGLNRFTDEDLEAATLFGHTAAAAWHNAQLYEELARRAMTDSLTGLFNSRWLREAGEREVAECRRRGAPLSIVLVDLDHFKQINDSGGHAAGDIVLQRVADELRGIARADDATVRLGGEEFILILRGSDADGALRVAADLRKAMAKVPIPPECAGIDQITASIGIATFPEHGATLADLVRAADVAMYGAKRDGRDRAKLACHSLRPLTEPAEAVA